METCCTAKMAISSDVSCAENVFFSTLDQLMLIHPGVDYLMSDALFSPPLSVSESYRNSTSNLTSERRTSPVVAFHLFTC